MSSKSRTFPIYIYDFMVEAIEREEVTLFLRPVYEENIYLDKIYSNIGYPGDTWYICEAGKMMEDLIFMRKDNSCVQNIGGQVVELSTAYEYGDREEGKSLAANKMPKWAARFQYEIIKVSFPVLLKDLSEEKIAGLGVRVEKHENSGSSYRWGNKVKRTPFLGDLREIFYSFWDETFAHGKPQIRSEVNPYVTIYEVKQL